MTHNPTAEYVPKFKNEAAFKAYLQTKHKLRDIDDYTDEAGQQVYVERLYWAKT